MCIGLCASHLLTMTINAISTTTTVCVRSILFFIVAMVLSGYTVSLMATEALGIDRTYFAAELGLVEPKWINKFPYG